MLTLSFLHKFEEFLEVIGRIMSLVTSHDQIVTSVKVVQNYFSDFHDGLVWLVMI